MKKMIMKILAVMLTVWYSMSIIGFDVHTCNGSGRSFVVTFIEGLTCEDIHPEHRCEKTSCCSGDHETCCASRHESCGLDNDSGLQIKTKSCCSNDYQVLALTGTVNGGGHDHFDECLCGLCPCAGFPVCEVPAVEYGYKSIEYLNDSGSGVASACERQAALRVWRI